jgi:hypothetical protein
MSTQNTKLSRLAIATNSDTRCCMHLSQTNLQLQANHWLQSSTWKKTRQGTERTQ